MKKILLMIFASMILFGCSNGEDNKAVKDENNSILDDSNDVEEAVAEDNVVEDEAQKEDDKKGNKEIDGFDLSNAEKTTNDSGEEVYLFPLGEEGKVRHYLHNYSIILEVNDFYITDTISPEIIGKEWEQKAHDGETFAVAEVTFKNDGIHSEYAEDDTSTTNYSQIFFIGLNLERHDKETAINDGGSVPYANGDLKPVTIQPGEEQKVHLVFPIDEEFADEEHYYLIDQSRSDVIYAWQLK